VVSDVPVYGVAGRVSVYLSRAGLRRPEGELRTSVSVHHEEGNVGVTVTSALPTSHTEEEWRRESIDLARSDERSLYILGDLEVAPDGSLTTTEWIPIDIPVDGSKITFSWTKLANCWVAAGHGPRSYISIVGRGIEVTDITLETIDIAGR
jgi:hypothetical protein